MANNIIQPAFSAGELAPGLYGRVDLSKYHTGAALLLNHFVDPKGGVSNRPGTKFVGRCLQGNCGTNQGGGGGGPQAPDWRIYFTHTGGVSVTDTYLLLGSVNFRNTIGGSNIAVGGTATASSTDATSGPVSAIVGGNNNTKWFTNLSASPPFWIRYTWPSGVNIQEITLGFPDTTVSNITLQSYFHAPLEFSLQYSIDGGANWITYYSWDLRLSCWLPYKNVTARFAVGYSPTWYRVYITTPAPTGSAYQFSAAQIRLTHGGSNAAVGGFCSQNTYNSYIPTDGNFASGAFGQTDISGYWGNGGAYGYLSEQNPTLPQWMSIGFCYPLAAMTEMQLEVRDAPVVGFFSNRYPTGFTIDSSTDFSSWTNLYTASGVGWVSGTPQQFSW